MMPAKGEFSVQSLSDRERYVLLVQGYQVMKYLSSQDIKDRQRNISDIKPYKQPKKSFQSLS